MILSRDSKVILLLSSWRTTKVRQVPQTVIAWEPSCTLCPTGQEFWRAGRSGYNKFNRKDHTVKKGFRGGGVKAGLSGCRQHSLYGSRC
jgi:hypothetical protein